MTDQTGADQHGAAGSRTGDVDVADEKRPDVTTDVQSGGATDLDAGGPDAGTATDDAAIRGGEDADAPRSERGRSDQQPDDTHAADDTEDGRDGSSRNEVRGDDEQRRGSDENVRGSEEDGQASDEERQKTAEEFAREHDPEKHDVAAGEEFRQEGDWTADDAGGPQVWDSEGQLVEGSTPGEPESSRSESSPSEPSPSESSRSASGQSASGRSEAQGGQSPEGSDGGPRTSSLDEIRDGGYGVGSAALIDDGAVPLGHPVKAWEDTKTFVAPDHEKYDEAEPHVWFADEHAAQRAGFRPVD